MIETIVIRNIKRDHSDKPIVALSETKFEKEESYQCDENKPGIWLMNWAMGANSLTEPNFCIVYCYSIFVMLESSLSRPPPGLDWGIAANGSRGFPSQCIAEVACWFRGVPGLALLKKSEI